jgi:hypothetical protein
MPTFVLLATQDDSLADAWQRQLPIGTTALRLESEGIATYSNIGLSAVIILDANSEHQLPLKLYRCPTVFVGEPRTAPYEQARISKRAKVFLSYDESLTRLTDLLPLLEDVAEKQSLVEMLTEKSRRVEPTRVMQRAQSVDSAEFWDFLEGAIENLDTKDRLLSECRRASRLLLRASHAVFFLRETDGFRADRGTSFFSSDDPLVRFFENHPTVIDGTNWDSPSDAVGELAVRNRLALWGARLLVPIHDNARLLGLVALGVRDDGQPYDELDRTRAVSYARLLRHLLGKCSQLSRLGHAATQVALGAKYLPGTIVLGPDEGVPKHVPVVVRDLIAQARKKREVIRVLPKLGQPFRASAGIVAESGGAWAFWEEASTEVHDAMLKERAGRLGVLKDLALTLNHELGNALVSLTTFTHAGIERPAPLALVRTVKNDVAHLKSLNTNLALMQSLDEGEATLVDVREIAREIGTSLNIRVEVGQDPVIIKTSKPLLDYALRAVLQTVAENRSEPGTEDLVVKVRSAGLGTDITAMLSLKGKNLELEGVLPEPFEGSVPNQGRVSVFLAKEILRLHHGEIHAGPGMESVEILISFRSL